jgi:hypothetical protein
MLSKGFTITNEDTIREITTFVKHTTTSGNTRYAADVGHDDTVMTIVNTTSAFQKNDFKEMCQDYLDIISTIDFRNYVNECLKNIDYVESVDYGQLLRVRKQVINKNKFNNDKGINWFNSNNQF